MTDEFNNVRKAERSRFENVVRDLGVENAERFLRRYDNAPHASAVIDLLQRLTLKSDFYGSHAKDICLLKYKFLPLAPGHPLFGQG